MEVFPLADEEHNGLFLTQRSTDNMEVEVSKNDGEDEYFWKCSHLISSHLSHQF